MGVVCPAHPVHNCSYVFSRSFFARLAALLLRSVICHTQPLHKSSHVSVVYELATLLQQDVTVVGLVQMKVLLTACLLASVCTERPAFLHETHAMISLQQPVYLCPCYRRLPVVFRCV